MSVQSKALCHHAVLYVSGDALRVIDDASKVRRLPVCFSASICLTLHYHKRQQ